MDEIDYDQPVKVSDHLAGVLARMLARSYPGTTAADITGELGKPAPERGILGMMAAGSLEEAAGAGSVIAVDGVLTAK